MDEMQRNLTDICIEPGGSTMNIEGWEWLVTHLFLPKRTPAEQAPRLEEREVIMLQFFSKSITETCTEAKLPMLAALSKMLKSWSKVQPTREQENLTNKFCQELAALQNGDTLPIYLRNQNATMLITRTNDRFEIATFRSSLPNKLIMSSVHSLSMDFPETHEVIEQTDILLSEVFAGFVHELATSHIDITQTKPSILGYRYQESNDVVSPELVTDLLVGILSPGQLAKPEIENTKRKVRKKLRDQVTKSSHYLPFRRSGMLMAIKVVLHLKTVDLFDMNQTVGTHVYKLLMLRIFTDTLKGLENRTNYNFDLCSQMLAKIGRRVLKLKNYQADKTLPSNIMSVIKRFEEICLTYTESAVTTLSEKLQHAWNNIALNAEKHVQNPRNATNSETINTSESASYQICKIESTDLEHSLANLDTFIEMVTGKYHENSGTNQQGKGKRRRRKKKDSQNKIQNLIDKPLKKFTTAEEISLVPEDYLKHSQINLAAWLYDAEGFIKYGTNQIENTAGCIYDVLKRYIVNAVPNYRNNPIGMSQLVLVCLKGLNILDQIVTKDFPLLLEYQLGILTETFDSLILPFKKDMDLLDELVDYFRIRNQNAFWPFSTIMHKYANANSFSVRFAQENKAMILLRQQILQDQKKLIQKKYEEIENCRKECLKMESEIQSNMCICPEETTDDGRTFKKFTADCVHCTYSRTLPIKRKSVNHLEMLLPEDPIKILAIVFELQSPEEVLLWRSLLASITYSILGQKVFGNENEYLTGINWVDSLNVAAYKQQNLRRTNLNLELDNANISQWNRRKNLDVFCDQKEFIVQNEAKCRYVYFHWVSFVLDLQSALTFQLKFASKSDPYLNLQHSISSTSFTQNSIIARKYECHKSLSIQEYICFGSVRAGNRIQLRNLYQAIHSDSLSLDQESVLALILQTLWQVGPRNGENKRDSHLDFLDTNFCKAFLDMLDRLVLMNSGNESNLQVVLISVLVTRRIAELNTETRAKTYWLMKKWRLILHKLMDKIMAKLDDISLDGKANSSGDSLKKSLLDSILCSLMSFSISETSDIVLVMAEETDILHWLRSLYLFRRRISGRVINLSEMYKTLLGFAKLLPLTLNLDEKIMQNDTLFISALHSFVSTVWNSSTETEPYIKSVKISEPDQGHGAVTLEYASNDIDLMEGKCTRFTFDLVQGTFLVNGYEESQIPPAIKSSALFKRYFKNVDNLRVQQFGENLYRTVQGYKGYHYEFQITNLSLPQVPSSNKPWYTNSYRNTNYSTRCDSDSETYADMYEMSSDDGTYVKYNHQHQDMKLLVVKEIQQSGYYILVDPTMLTANISAHLIQNFSHWFDASRNKIMFRKDGESSEKFALEKVNTEEKPVWKLRDFDSEEYILSIDSNGFRQACESLSRLEIPKYINVTINKQQEKTAYIRRHCLKFLLKEDGLHDSVEYPNFYICGNQSNVGTLVGLENGLLLQKGISKIWLLPHSSILIQERAEHQKVFVKLKKLKQPTYFVYELDEVLKRVKPQNNKPAWLFLAALHASTSSALPDPFTGLTGTEMAVSILQSACVWSCSPYDSNSRAIIKFIKKLAPRRNYTPSTYGFVIRNLKEEQGYTETIVWPGGICSLAAYDGFALIAEKLLMDSNKLEVLYKENPKSKRMKKPYSSEKLCIRAYLRYLSMYNQAAEVEVPNYMVPSSLALLSLTTEMVHELSFRVSNAKNKQLFENLLQISLARAGQSCKDIAVTNLKSLSIFLLTRNYLNAPKPDICLTNSGSFQNLLETDFRKNWLKLYNMASSSRTKIQADRFTIVLCFAAYRGDPMEQIEILHLISQQFLHGNTNFPSITYLRNVDAENISNVDEEFKSYSDPLNCRYDSEIIEDILKNHIKPFTEISKPMEPQRPPGYSWLSFGAKLPEHVPGAQEHNIQVEKYRTEMEVYNDYKQAYLIEVQNKLYDSKLGTNLKEMLWPSPKVKNQEEFCRVLETHNVEAEQAIESINMYLSAWFHNHKLNVFVSNIEKALNVIATQQEFTHPTILFAPNLFKKVTVVNPARNEPQIHEMVEIELNLPHASHDRAKRIFETGLNLNLSASSDFVKTKTLLEQHIREISSFLLDLFTADVYNKIVSSTSIFPRLEPKNIVKFLCKRPKDNAQKTSSHQILKDFAGALAVLYCHMQQINRCCKAETSAALQREIENLGHVNWRPEEFSEWLLLELELDITIRPIQVDVAKQMMLMPSENGNGVTQLNMGEGKTSVIVPMLCTTLAKKKTTLSNYRPYLNVQHEFK